MNTLLGSPIFLFDNIICLYHFDFYHHQKNQVGAARQKHGRNAKTSFCIIDAQSVKNTDCAQNKGYDVGKKVSGVKRHILVDGGGYAGQIFADTVNA